MVGGGMDWIDLTQNREGGGPLWMREGTFQFRKKAKNLLTS